MKTGINTIALTFFMCLFFAGIAVAENKTPPIPVPGTVTLVDLGARSCKPCKMMAPILEELEKTYKGRAAILFIDVWQNHATAEKFDVSIIPTQIFFNAEGKEVYRHVGFMDKQSIVRRLEYMLEKKLHD
jgi:thioredoxin 1